MLELVPLLLINGLVFGLVVALVSLGLSVIFGLLDVVNVAHGDLFMIGAVLAWLTVSVTGSYWLALAVVPLVGAVAGVLMERGLMRPIQGNPSRAIVATFGLSLILQEGVRATFGAAPKSIASPIGGDVPVFGFPYELYRLFAAAVSVVAITGFFLFLHRTRFGTWMRAVRHDPEAALIMGIPVQRVLAVTFAVGTALAMLGGVVIAPITSVDFRLGLDMLPLCFIAVIIGGMGNLPGTAAAAILLSSLEGVISGFAEPMTARVTSLGLMIVLVLLRPHGVFARSPR